HDARVAREELRHSFEITRLGRRHECGEELRMFRVDLARTLRRSRAAWSRAAHVRSCAGGKLPACTLTPLQPGCHFAEREIEYVVQQEGSPLERRVRDHGTRHQAHPSL